MEAGLRVAQDAGQPYSEIYARFGLGYVHLRNGKFAVATRVFEPGLALGRAFQTRLVQPFVTASLGSAYLWSGRASDGLPLLEEAVEGITTMSMVGLRSWFIPFLAEAYLVLGRIAQARELVEQSVDHARSHQERAWEAWGPKLLGDIYARVSVEPEQAGNAYRQALALAAALRMRPLVAHCHLSLGRTCARTDRHGKAEEHLTTAITMYREMAMPYWLERAQEGVKRLA